MKYHHALDIKDVALALTFDKMGKPHISMSHGIAPLALVTPPGITNWPRCDGEGNYGTMFGPAEKEKSKFTLDLTDADYQGTSNEAMRTFFDLIDAIDDKLLTFVHLNQEKILNRKNLHKSEIAMLQIRGRKPKTDKMTGGELGHSMTLQTPVYKFDGKGGKEPHTVPICDCHGAPVEYTVGGGDLVCAATRAANVYCNVGGDKFGVSWSLDSVQVVCPRRQLEVEAQFDAFMTDHAAGQAICSEPVGA